MDELDPKYVATGIRQMTVRRSATVIRRIPVAASLSKGGQRVVADLDQLLDQLFDLTPR